MNKLTIAALAAATLTSISILPVFAQAQIACRIRCELPANSPEACGEQLGHLKRVYPEEVLGIDDSYRVWVTEFCPTSELMRADGNAAYLRTSIAQNDVLLEMLEQKGYHYDDVFAVKMMGDDTISLYVHRFER